MPRDMEGETAARREAAVARVYEQLATITRRASVRDRTGGSPLTLVDHGLRSLVEAQPGISPAELARVLGLNRSTTSRQIAALDRAGLLRRGEGPRAGYALALTPAGEQALAASRSAHLASLHERLASW